MMQVSENKTGPNFLIQQVAAGLLALKDSKQALRHCLLALKASKPVFQVLILALKASGVP